MKINRNNQDLKIANWNSEYSCDRCVFNSHYNFYYCNLFCTSRKIWIKDIFNSDIFKL